MHRWITLAINVLRLFVQTLFPGIYLKKMVQYILCVYAPVLFDLKFEPHVTMGSVHFFKLMSLGYQHFSKIPDVRELQTFKSSLLNNDWFAHIEPVIVALLADPDTAKRRLGFKLIMEARKVTRSPRKIRELNKPASLNWLAEDYSSMIDIKNMDSKDITEPPVTFHLSEDELLEIVNGKRSMKTIFRESPIPKM